MVATFWQQVPFIRLLVPFAAGIAHARYSYMNLPESLAICGLLLAIHILFTYRNTKLFLEPLCGFTGFLLLYFFGFYSSVYFFERESKNHFHLASKSVIWVEITSKPNRKSKSLSAVAQAIYQSDSANLFTSCSGNLALTFPISQNSHFPNYGDRLLLFSGIHEISGPSNPGGFDYRAFMRQKGIIHQAYLTERNFKITDHRNGNILFEKIYAFQDYISKTLSEYLSADTEKGIAEALLFGYDDHIEPDLINAYSRTGTLHVLAVSGMHVGLIYLIIGWIFSPLKLSKKLSWIEPVSSILLIWIYSALCGLSPSILRASLMLTFVITGKLINQTANSINSLAASAFLLLCINPNYLFDVGFQLSYAAVAGILVAYKWLYLLTEFRFRLWDEIWKVISVSLASQVFTLPLSLFYFHQFPNYFLPANLIVIPVTTIAIYSGILLMAVSPFPTLATWVALILTWSIKASDFLVQFISNLPFSSVGFIHFEFPDLILVYFITFSVILLLVFRSGYWLILCLTGYCALIMLPALRHQTSNFQNELVIYHTPKGLSCTLRSGSKTFWLSDSLNRQTQGQSRKLISEHLIHQQVKDDSVTSLLIKNGWIKLPGGKRLTVCSSTPASAPDFSDWLVITEGKFINLDWLLEYHKAGQVILCKGLSFQKRKALKVICGKYNTPCYDIADSNAFVKYW